jgi:hypothetical protein
MCIIIITGMNVVDNLNSVKVINKPCMSSRCMSLLPRATLHSDSEQLLLSIISLDCFMIFWINSHIPQLFHDIFVPISSAVSWYCGHIGNSIKIYLFPTRLLTSEDEYKWYWHQMIYFPETINTISIRNTISPICLHSFFPSCAHYSLCACWHPEAVEESSSLTSCRLLIPSRLVTSFSFPCLGSTDAPYSRHGGPGPLFPRWRPHSQGPHTLPHRDPEQYLPLLFTTPLKSSDQEFSPVIVSHNPTSFTPSLNCLLTVFSYIVSKGGFLTNPRPNCLSDPSFNFLSYSFVSHIPVSYPYSVV